ncbi:hypothetical protein D3C72_1791100 [compost metagenome]
MCHPIRHRQCFAPTLQGLVGKSREPECMRRPCCGQYAEVAAHQRHMLGVLGLVIRVVRTLIRSFHRAPIALLDQAPHDVGPRHHRVGTRAKRAQPRKELLAQALCLRKFRPHFEKECKADLSARLLTGVACISAEFHGASQRRFQLGSRPAAGDADGWRKVELQCQRLPGALLWVHDLLGL